MTEKGREKIKKKKIENSELEEKNELTRLSKWKQRKTKTRIIIRRRKRKKYSYCKSSQYAKENNYLLQLHLTSHLMPCIYLVPYQIAYQ